MSTFATTFSACQQLSLLDIDGEASAVQAARSFRDVGVADFFRLQIDDMRRAGHRVDVEQLDPQAGTAVLGWRLPGRATHPRDTYLLAVQLTGAGATARFYGPSRRTQALLLATRHLNHDTLARWTATFFEWALTTRESR